MISSRRNEIPHLYKSACLVTVYVTESFLRFIANGKINYINVTAVNNNDFGRTEVHPYRSMKTVISLGSCFL